MKGKLIVIEGSDGSGKSTQQQLLNTYLLSHHIPVQSLKFPQYTDNFFGKTIRAYLDGKLGQLRQMNPYFISIAYAMDRAQARKKLLSWLKEGNMVVLDRYATSNLAHQASRMPEKERETFMKWDVELEYTVNKIPKEDSVIYLYVPHEVAQKLIADSRKKDMVEKDKKYVIQSEQVYLSLAKKFPHWVKIDCVDSQGNMRSREEIHEEIVEVLKSKGIL